VNNLPYRGIIFVRSVGKKFYIRDTGYSNRDILISCEKTGLRLIEYRVSVVTLTERRVWTVQ